MTDKEYRQSLDRYYLKQDARCRFWNIIGISMLIGGIALCLI